MNLDEQTTLPFKYKVAKLDIPYEPSKPLAQNCMANALAKIIDFVQLKILQGKGKKEKGKNKKKGEKSMCE